MTINNDVNKNFKFKLIHEDKHTGARAGEITTPHGVIQTPVFMPVGTHATVKAVAPKDLEDMDIQIILGNTYHLHISPGSQLIKKMGGLHEFMNWKRPILTDSGGFQVFSLQGKSITEEGAEFKGAKGKKILLSPEVSIGVQQDLGSDIMMAFDECIPYPASRDYVQKSMDRTHRWLDRCVQTWDNPKQALFGIVQGGVYQDLRSQCAQAVVERDLPGYAIGGVSVGEGPEHMESIVKHTAPLLPKNKPRYVMGVGTPEDLLMIWENGVDMSDCIIPTKYARGGTVYTNKGKIRITHKNYRHDKFPLDPFIESYASQFSRSYIKHLFDSNEIFGAMLTSIHNIAFYKSLASRARNAILNDRFKDFKQDFLSGYN